MDALVRSSAGDVFPIVIYPGCSPWLVGNLVVLLHFFCVSVYASLTSIEVDGLGHGPVFGYLFFVFANRSAVVYAIARGGLGGVFLEFARTPGCQAAVGGWRVVVGDAFYGITLADGGTGLAGGGGAFWVDICLGVGVRFVGQVVRPAAGHRYFGAGAGRTKHISGKRTGFRNSRFGVVGRIPMAFFFRDTVVLTIHSAVGRAGIDLPNPALGNTK